MKFNQTPPHYICLKPNTVYSLDQITQIAGQRPIKSHLSYGTVWSVVDLKTYSQYTFVFYPFNEGNGYILIAVDGEPPVSQNDESG